MCEHLWKRHHVPRGVKSVHLAHAELMFEIWGTYSTENTTRGDCRLESGSCSVCSLYLSVILCASVRASPCLRKHGYANLCACAPIMNHLYGRGKSNIACSSKSYNPAILFFFLKTRMYSVHTVTRTRLVGNYTNFRSAFFIFITDIQAITYRLSLHYRCSTNV